MKTHDMAQISIFAVLSAVGARIMVSLPLVPFTLQTLVCMMAGMVLGSKKGAASQALYMLMGLIGIPVFTGGGGPASVLTPSFGYIAGFVACGWATGHIIELRSKDSEPTRRDYLIAAAAGIAAVYSIGLIHLYMIMNFFMPGNGMPLMKVLSVGFLSTIGGDAIKAFIAASAAMKLKRTGIFKN